MNIRRSQYSYGTFFLFALLFTLSCGPREETASADQPEEKENNIVTLTEAQYKISNIEYCRVEKKTINGVIHASGQLDVPPQSKVSISAPMGGVVKETKLLQGSYVKKGQTVVILEHNDYIQLQQDYQDAVSQAEYLKTEYERQQELSKENVNAQKTLQKAKADFLSSRARVDGLSAKLRLLNIDIAALESGRIESSIRIFSPIDGYVTKVLVNIGSYVNSNSVLFEIVNTEHLHAELTVFEKDVHQLRVGQKVLFTLANETEQRRATVHLVGKEISSDRSIRVHCHLEKPDKDLIPGMYLQAIVETDSAHSSALPEGAIMSFDNKKYVFVELPLQKRTDEAAYGFEMREIAVGETQSGFTHVILPPDISEKGNFVCKGGYTLLSKLKNSEE